MIRQLISKCAFPVTLYNTVPSLMINYTQTNEKHTINILANKKL